MNPEIQSKKEERRTRTPTTYARRNNHNNIHRGYNTSIGSSHKLPWWG
jgi:hypothetical protein